MNVNDQILLDRLKAQDAGAFTELFKQYRKWLLVVALTILDDENEAKDLVQEFFIDLWEKRLYEKIDTSLKSFLYTSIRNRSLNKIKKEAVRKKRLDRIPPAGQTLPGNFMEDQELRRQINTAIEKVPPESAKVFRLTYLEQKNRNEVAQTMGISPSTVKHQLARAIRILRERLKNIKS